MATKEEKLRREVKRLSHATERISIRLKEAVEILEKLSNGGAWFYSSVEFDCEINGEKIKEEIDELLRKIKQKEIPKG